MSHYSVSAGSDGYDTDRSRQSFHPINGRNVDGVPLRGSKYAEIQERRKNFNLTNRLQTTGVTLDIDLPQICVLGSQSAGKSSLIESISGVSLPRASGTCTRCPTECTLVNSNEDWKCDVSLRFLVNEDGEVLSPVRNIPFGETITDPSKVEDRLRRAQLAILNSNINASDFPTSFLKAPAESSGNFSGNSFSRNFISLKISGPQVIDLSFVDLPGVIATVAGGGNKGDIEAVKNLASAYIKNPKSIILLAVTCETDFENQGAREIAQTYDPEGKRTIGVLTKPDRIEMGEEERWLKFLRNESERLDNGWFCVKLPGPEDLKKRIGWMEARDKEEAYFSHPPWSSLAQIRHRLTVKRLTDRLSEILSDLITERLPELQGEIETQKQETRDQLRRLPPPMTDDPVGEVLRLVSEFHGIIGKHVEGTTSKNGLVQQIKHLEVAFRHNLRGTAPRFIPFHRNEGKAEVPHVNFLSPEDQDLGVKGVGPIFYLDEVEERARDAISRELPGNVPFEVKRELISEFIKYWDGPANLLFSKVERTFEFHFSAVAKSHFTRYKSLHSLVSTIMARQRSTCHDRTIERLEWFIDVEHTATFTLNQHYLEDYRSKFEAFYKSLRHRKHGYATVIQRLTSPDVPLPPTPSELSPVAEHAMLESNRVYSTRSVTPERWPQPDVPDSPPFHSEKERRDKLIADLIDFGLPGSVEALLKLLPEDEGDGAIKIMADVRAYWQVAFKRFADYVALAVDKDYVRGFSKNLDNELRKQLGLSGPDAREKCAQYLAQPKDVVTLRETLTAKLKRLEDAQREIEDLAF